MFLKRLNYLWLQVISIVIFLHFLYLEFFKSVKIGNENQPQLAFWNFIIQLVVMAALMFLLAPKPKKPPERKPLTLEQFDIPTAEEGRAIQVLFGKKYVSAPNVVWYGDLKSQEVMG